MEEEWCQAQDRVGLHGARVKFLSKVYISLSQKGRKQDQGKDMVIKVGLVMCTHARYQDLNDVVWEME